MPVKKTDTVKKTNTVSETKPMVIKDNQGEVVATYDRDMVETIKATVAKGATDDELTMFLSLASQYGLDPFKKELWFLKYKGEPQIFTSRDGFVKIAKQNPDMKAINSFAVYENDEFELEQSMTENGFEITGFKHKFEAGDRGKILGAYCVIEYYTKKPLVTYCDFKEYSSGTPIWRKNSSAMIRKVSEKEACRLSAGISGLHIPEEMPSYYQKKSSKFNGADDDLDRLEAGIFKDSKSEVKKEKEVETFDVEAKEVSNKKE